jgi:hypothetical protein
MAVRQGVARAFVGRVAAALAGAPPPDEEGWIRVGPAGLSLSGHPGRAPADAARLAVSECQERARDAHDRAAALLGDRSAMADAGPNSVSMAPPSGVDPSESATREERAGSVAAQVRARQKARAACAVARLRVAGQDERGTLPPNLSASLEEAESAWRTLPLR